MNTEDQIRAKHWLEEQTLNLGRLEVGSQADFVVVDSRSALEALYCWGNAPLHTVYVGGQEVNG